MFKNYLLIAWRTIARNRVYTIITILGLALGICGCLVLFLMTNFEFSFDRDHPDGDRIYRIVAERTMPSGDVDFANSPYDDLAPLQTTIAGYAGTAAIISCEGRISVPQAGQEPKIFENKIPDSWQETAEFTWPSYFDMFPHHWLAGSAQTLDQPNTVVLTISRARLYFGDIPASSMLGRTVVYDDSLHVRVTGIVDDYPGNTDLGYTDFLSVTTATHSFLRQRIPKADWTSLSPHQSMAFVKLAPGVTQKQIEARYADFVRSHIHLRMAGMKLRVFLQPLSALHFTDDFHRGDDGDNWRKPYLPTLYALMGVAVFILLIAAVNFVNLSTAQSMARIREVGVRKVMGSRKRDIRIQFLTEAFVTTVFSVIVALVFVNPVIHLLHDYIPPGVRFHPFRGETPVFILALTVVTTLLAGFYPAWVLSGYLPVSSLKGVLPAGTGGSFFIRRALIVFQFTIALIFVTGAIVIRKQIFYMQHADKGFDTDRVLSMSDWSDPPEKLAVYAQAISHIPGVEQVIRQGTPPMGFAQNRTFFSATRDARMLRPYSAHMGGADYIPFYHMRLVAGRNVFPSDSLQELVINATMAKQLGCKTPQQAIGRILYSAAGPDSIGKGYPIVGVVADFHVSSFHDPIPPAVIENLPERQFGLAIRVSPAASSGAALTTVLAAMEKEWKQEFPDKPFRTDFLAAAIGWLFGQEESTAWLVNLAMIVTIFISCMGLFGLGLFTLRRRSKEISIRKVLGASVQSITTLMSRDYVALVGVAFCIAMPISWWGGSRWLADFAYRTTLSWWVFILAGMIALLVALVTVGGQAVRAAKANPVQGLRAE